MHLSSEMSIVVVNIFFPVVCVQCVLDHDVKNIFTGSGGQKNLRNTSFASYS